MQLKVINYFNCRFQYKRNVLAEPPKAHSWNTTLKQEAACR
jgi:hypothetical protein